MKIYMIEPVLSDIPLYMVEVYKGWTTNEFILNRYIEYLENTCGVKTKVEFYETIKTTTDEDVNNAFRPEIKLKTLKSDVSDNILIINDNIYGRFVEKLVSNNEVNKIRYDLYRLCSTYAVEYIAKYLKSDDTEYLLKVLVYMSKYSSYVKDLYSNYSIIDILGHSKYDSELWGILDLYRYMDEFIRKDTFIEKYMNLSTLEKNAIYGMHPENPFR